MPKKNAFNLACNYVYRQEKSIIFIACISQGSALTSSYLSIHILWVGRKIFKNIPNLFEVYLVSSKKVWRFFKIFVAFSEYLIFFCGDEIHDILFVFKKICMNNNKQKIGSRKKEGTKKTF